MAKKTNVDELIVLDGVLSDMLYTKPNGYGNGHFGIMLISVQKLYRGEIPEEFGHPPLCTLKCVGTYLLPLSEGNKYRVMLSLETDQKWGKQFRIVSITEPFDVQDSNNVWEYLGSELTKNQFELLYDGQGKVDVLAALANSNVEELCKIKGIGPTGAKRIIRRYNDNLSKLEQIVRLKDMGFSPAVRKSLLKQYPDPMQMAAFCDELRHNFYAIMNKVKGFGWERTDKIAREQHGFAEDCKERIQAYITFFFDDIANSKGHSWVKKEELLDAIFDIAPNADPPKVGEYIKDMLDRNLLYYDRTTQRIGSQLLHDVEKATAQELVRLMKAPNWELKGLEESIKRCEAITGFEYTDQQKAVMRGISENKVSVLTAPSGCGKSSTMYPITEALKRQGKLFSIVALSGKASLNIGEATHSINFSSTIHRLLGYTGGDEDETGDNKRASSTFFDDTFADAEKDNRSRDPETGKLIIDFLIVDEVSMIGGYLFRRLVEALPDHAKLVLVGDEGQLEAIGYANILWDIKKSGVIPYFTLTKIMRQAAKSGILSDSLKIYRKEHFIPADLLEPVVHGELTDFKIVPQDTMEEIAASVVEEYKGFLKLHISPKDIVVITQKRARGVLSSAALNLKLQSIANPSADPRHMSWTYRDSGEEYTVKYRVGDPVMMMQNDYHVPLLEPTVGKDSVAVFNGNIGKIIDIDGAVSTRKSEANYGSLVIQFPQGRVIFFKSMLEKLQLGYAATCHKLQGSGIPYVIGVVDPSAYSLLTNEALYTEITRAKKYCILIGSPRSIRMAVRKSAVKAKQTWLAELLIEEYEAAEQSQLPSGTESDIPF